MAMGCANFSCFNRSTGGARGGGPASPAASLSLDRSFQMKEFVVRVIHAGGREELYSKPLPASHLMRKHPAMCVARPDVFRNPHLSLLKSDEKLLVGHVYYLLPEKTAQKLKRRHANKLIPKGSLEQKEQSNDKDSGFHSAEISDESILSVRASYISKPTKSPKKQSKRGKKKLFVPPIQRNPSMRGSGWEPSMDSIIELSP